MNETTQSPATSKQPQVVLVVVYSLAILSVLGFIGTFFLVRDKVDGTAIAVFSGLAGTALGGLLSALNDMRTPTPPAEIAAVKSITPIPNNPVQGPMKP